ncbi:hypothetical protein MPER_03815 [Moniliophthora perniciosa FA553]|nr:hypothetical protein MPER_03815 [Moniliophthora perniciosa FA553]
MLASRISRRVLAEHHIALSEAYVGQYTRSGRRHESEAHVGIIFTALDVKKSIERCAILSKQQPIEEEYVSTAPEVIIDGHLETKFSYIREHLEFVYGV